jgi:hypothetical protein
MLYAVKVKVNPSHACAGTVGRRRYSSNPFPISALEGVGGQHHAPAALPPEKRPGTYCTGGWVGIGTGLDGHGKFRLYRDSIPGLSSRTRLSRHIYSTLFKIYPTTTWNGELVIFSKSLLFTLSQYGAIFTILPSFIWQLNTNINKTFLLPMKNLLIKTISSVP